MQDLQNLIEFTKFTHKFQQVIRTILATGEDRNENDAEHSFQLALIAWYVINSMGLDYDLEKVIKYAIAHDLVETYAGDTYFHTKDKESIDNKQEREAEAAKRIAIEFPEFKELHEVIQAYEEKSDKEVKFIYALDKMIPVMNIYIDKGKSWHKHNVSLEMIRTKDKKISENSDIEKLWQELVILLNKDKYNLFPQNNK
jgi:putative hydrolase of HD superfamily